MADKIHPAKNDDAANQSVNERPSLNWNGVKVKEFFQLYQQCVSLFVSRSTFPPPGFLNPVEVGLRARNGGDSVVVVVPDTLYQASANGLKSLDGICFRILIHLKDNLSGM
ncbi:hypothetical protein Fcan01_09533 [Folsomia candida]|uniref:Uncharacterized protein n=1 Tax=Folsomia candida TaxID=158441 RepID=A0A226EEN8_FOLCA|nr:hypothetical protein Fcan01_09533 [Folsomia candida]